MSDTVQRLKDLVTIADNKEVKLLAGIMCDYVVQERKTGIGFITDPVGGGVDSGKD